jgi:hypothetical protein
LSCEDPEQLAATVAVGLSLQEKLAVQGVLSSGQFLQ